MSTMRTIIQTLTLSATGTGSVYFTADNTPFNSVQIMKQAGATTMEFASASYSNFSGRDVAGVELGGQGFVPLTASAYSAYWVPESGPLPVAFTASAAPASTMCYLSGAQATRHVKITVGSITGGTFLIAGFGKEG